MLALRNKENREKHAQRPKWDLTIKILVSIVIPPISPTKQVNLPVAQLAKLPRLKSNIPEFCQFFSHWFSLTLVFISNSSPGQCFPSKAPQTNLPCLQFRLAPTIHTIVLSSTPLDEDAIQLDHKQAGALTCAQDTKRFSFSPSLLSFMSPYL